MVFNQDMLDRPLFSIHSASILLPVVGYVIRPCDEHAPATLAYSKHLQTLHQMHNNALRN